MLPSTHTETPQQAAERQANFILLRSLETRLPPVLFEQVVNSVSYSLLMFQVTQSMDLPKRIDWTGKLKDLTFTELKVNLSQIDQNFLTQLLESVATKSNSQIQKQNAQDQIQIQNAKRTHIITGNHRNLSLQQKSLHLQTLLANQKQNLISYQISRFDRMKTVFGHALIEEGYNAPIYNVKFDQTGEYIISGADDGHQDVITDLDVSKCNKYLATASKDGRAIIWDWQRCIKVDEINAHEDAITNIKFFSLKIKNSISKEQKKDDEIQILVTCSEDGTIKLFDELTHLSSQPPPTSEKATRRTKARQEALGLRKERFSLELTPEDYRPGSKNKKIDSVQISSSGLIAAGSGKGDILLWQLDASAFKKQSLKACPWIGQFKKHQKTVHFVEFSPNNKYLLTGSIDGTAKVWNIEREKKQKESTSSSLSLSDDRLVVTLEEKRKSWQCDSVAWSCNGRYAIASLSGKVDENPNNNKEISVIKVWDSITGSVVQDLAKGNGIQLQNFSFVIAPHPKYEEIMFSGSDGGTICLWNLKTRTLIKKFLEYGVYSYEKYTMNDPYDGRFSPDGSCFIVGSVMGTISLFTNECANYKYEATRVEQFFPSDNIKHDSNIYYYENQIEPQICGYSLIPYEIQPPSSLIGKFKNARNLNYEDYHRNFLIRRELCIEEEKFIQGQLEEGLRNSMFNPDNERDLAFDEQDIVMNEEFEGNEDEVVIRRGRHRINSQVSNIQPNINNQLGSQEDQEALNGIVNAERRQFRGRRQNIANRVNRVAIQQINPNYDPDNDLYDRESDENFEISRDEEPEPSEDFEIESSNSEEDYGVHQRRNARDRQRTQFNQQRIEENKRRENSRAQRAMRRQARQEKLLQEDNEDVTEQSRRKRRNVIEDSEESEEDEQEYDLSDLDKKITKNKRLKKNNNRDEQDEQDSESELQSEESSFERKTKQKKDQNKRSDKHAKEREGSRRNLRNRQSRKSYKEIDDSHDFDEDLDKYEERHQHTSTRSQEEEKVPQGLTGGGKRRRQIKDDSDQEMIDVQGDYELVIQNNSHAQDDLIEDPNNSKKCSFCLRMDQPILGPFFKQGQNNKPNAKGLYFHKDCIEVNNYSYFCYQQHKWLNIGKALEIFNKKPCMCSRCDMIGSTIKCTDCFKMYHGHLCSSLYMIFYDGRKYQCFECRNKTNYLNFSQKPPQFEKKEIKQIKNNIPRDYLLETTIVSSKYIPQCGDEVFYFFQGHEKFISFYNCYFYSGITEQLNFQYPWKLHNNDLENPTLCKITRISYKYPQANTLYLLKKYGKSSSQFEQTPQIITHLELKILNDDEEDELTFELDLFPNDLPDFLVLKNQYKEALDQFETLNAEGNLIGKIFPVKQNLQQKVKIIGIQQREPTLYPSTNWESIICKEEVHRPRNINRRGQRGDADDREQQIIMSFWELQLNQNHDGQLSQPKAFTPCEKQKVMQVITEVIENKPDEVKPFLERVQLSIAPDYRKLILAEMYLNLIQERVLNDYYRTQEHFYFDIDLIYQNCRLYNGEENQLTSIAKKITDRLKREIKSSLSEIKAKVSEETKIQIAFPKNMIGKLTAPLKNNQQLSTFDQFKKNLEVENGNGKRKQIEETKINPNGLNNIQPRRKKLEKFDEEDFPSEDESSNQVSDTDFKATPKINNQQMIIGGQRRLTRQANRINYADNSSIAYSTEEKGNRMNDLDGSASIIPTKLGKRTTRSGRSYNQVKESLNEDDLARDFDQRLDQEDFDLINSGAQVNKRLRHH